MNKKEEINSKRWDSQINAQVKMTGKKIWKTIFRLQKKKNYFRKSILLQKIVITIKFSYIDFFLNLIIGSFYAKKVPYFLKYKTNQSSKQEEKVNNIA